ncbi:MAG: hypothetical protein IT441_07205 [Phycisphaeraceae bacterium]|nr:hypothetical protein [Phycisphaeraceae bacterium]
MQSILVSRPDTASSVLAPRRPASWMVLAALLLTAALLLHLLIRPDQAILLLGDKSLLASHWGRWLGLPIAVPGLIGLGLHALTRSPLARRWSPGLRLAPAVAIGAACLWLLCAQLIMTHSIELRLLIVLALGLTLAATVLSPRLPDADRARAVHLGLATAALGLLLPQLVNAHLASIPNPYYDTGPGPRRLVMPLDGQHPLAPHDVPMLGSPDAPVILLSFLDYTDPRARVTQRSLAEVRKRYGDNVAVMPVIYPIHPTCNPNVASQPDPERQNACSFARLALAVWRVSPDKFQDMHLYLCNLDEPSESRTIEQALTHARDLIGPDGLNRGLSDPWVIQQMFDYTQAKPQLGGTTEAGEKEDHLPVVMWRTADLSKPGHIVLGMVGQGEALYDWLERELNLVPADKTAAPDHPSDPARQAAKNQIIDLLIQTAPTHPTEDAQ